MSLPKNQIVLVLKEGEMSDKIHFDFSRVSNENLDRRLKEVLLEIKRTKRQLNGPALKCDGCGAFETDRDKLRLGHDSDGNELVLCGECGYILYRKGIVTAPFGKVMRTDLERAEDFALAAKEELARRAKRAEEMASRESRLEASGFFERFKKKKEEGNSVRNGPTEIEEGKEAIH